MLKNNLVGLKRTRQREKVKYGLNEGSIVEALSTKSDRSHQLQDQLKRSISAYECIKSIKH